MPKTYQAPEPKQEPGRESKPRKTVGVYGRPERTGPSRELLIAIAVIVAIVVMFVLYRLARGEEHQWEDRAMLPLQHLHISAQMKHQIGMAP